MPDDFGDLEWCSRVCAEGDGKVYVVDTRAMTLYLLDLASLAWKDELQIDICYRAEYAAMTYSNARLYISGGDTVGGDIVTIQNRMISLTIHGAGKSRVPAQNERGMLYSRVGHRMAGVPGRILVCGGVGDTGRRLAKCEVFDLATSAWSHIADMPQPSADFTLIPNSTNLFLLGGIKRTGQLTLPLPSQTRFQCITWSVGSGNPSLHYPGHWPTSRLRVGAAPCGCWQQWPGSTTIRMVIQSLNAWNMF